MSRIICTSSEDELYKSVSNTLGIEESDVRYYIIENLSAFFRYSGPRDINIKHFIKFIKNLSYIHKFGGLMIDYITATHLTARLNSKNMRKTPLYNLFDALINETELSLFLKKYGFSFKKKKCVLDVFYQDRLVNWSDYYSGRKESAARMLNRRFRGNKIVGLDKCVNGFLFNTEIQKSGNVRHIKYCPEMIQNVATVFDCLEMVYDWQSNAQRYKILFKAKISNVYFDGCRKLNIKQKTYLFYRNVLYYLFKVFYNGWNEHENPIVCMNDNLSVPVDDILKVYKIKE